MRFLRGHQGRQGHRPYDDDNDKEDDDKVEDNNKYDDNNKDDNNDKGISVPGLDRDNISELLVRMSLSTQISMKIAAFLIMAVLNVYESKNKNSL